MDRLQQIYTGTDNFILHISISRIIKFGQFILTHCGSSLVNADPDRGPDRTCKLYNWKQKFIFLNQK
jgi:hypothetical protein